ncbi:MICOS complex subunit MIC60, mitochondrial [Mercurialis annua]|uniref:MICOS complex subunit MIC60, mitochondrial n=1 Tax=Mercurialis annua TaxID=3986 RepID=UPI00215F3F6E|nr:MICOS complex subunit MIC60, mitochondrial [Mercurialis annua]
MLRRSILELSSRRSVWRIPRRDTSQPLPSLLSIRNEFSTSSQQNANPKPGSSGKQPKLNNYLPIIFGVAFVGGVYSAYELGYLDQFIGRKEKNSVKVGSDFKDEKETKLLEEQLPSTTSEEPVKLSHEADQTVQKVETQIDLPHFEGQQKVEAPIDIPHVETKQKAEIHDDISHVEAEKRVELQSDVHPHEAPSETKTPYIQEKSVVPKEDDSIAVQHEQQPEISQTSKSTGETSEGVHVSEIQNQVNVAADKYNMEAVASQQLATDSSSKSTVGDAVEDTSLLESYHLKDRNEESTATEILEEQADGSIGELNDGYVTDDGKLVMSFLQAIHAAEKRQAELDARAFADEKRAIKEKYEKELRDARARELMRAEEAAMLDKEIKRERAKAAAAIRTLQEKMEEKLKIELEQKESEAETTLKKLQELAKAELTAAVASEKAAQIEKMAEANLNINALCMAFYARSEEARQIHSVHKLALGALALEDALSKGLPIQQELDALNTYLEGIDKDSLIHLVLSTLPEETRSNGTDTLLQLNQKFNALKGTLRHYILIPPGGGGILAHATAHIASWLRLKEVDPSGDGIESVISRVESFLADGKLAEAANALQEGLRGSEAEGIAGDWVRQAKNRAITEQALTVLQSYAACISLTQ